MRAVLAALLVLAACDTPLRPDDPYTKLYRDEWAVGQRKVASLRPPPLCDPYIVQIEGIAFHMHDGPFTCGDVKGVNGCFQDGHIAWNIHTPTVLRHESGHAILWKMHDLRWTCFEHLGEPSQCQPEDTE